MQRRVKDVRVTVDPTNVDGVGFDRFFRAEYARLVATAAALTGDRELGRDIAQEALARAFGAWHEVSRLERPGTWVRRVALNLAIDSTRRGRRESAANARQLATTRSLDDPVESDHDFWRAVGALPERQRAATVLHYVADLAVNDIAETMQVASGTVKATLSHARANLARALTVEESR